jgi:hypothetical protein
MHEDHEEKCGGQWHHKDGFYKIMSAFQLFGYRQTAEMRQILRGLPVFLRDLRGSVLLSTGYPANGQTG